MSIDVIIEDPRWEASDLEALAQRAASLTLIHLGFSADQAEMAVLGTNDQHISVLNGQFRGKDTPTNVLSWPSDERGAEVDGEKPAAPGPELDLGDIALSFDTCLSEASAQKKPLDQHILHLVVHGVLHLLGYDHEREKDADLMESIEIAILAKLGVPNPYV